MCDGEGRGGGVGRAGYVISTIPWFISMLFSNLKTSYFRVLMAVSLFTLRFKL